MLIPLSELLTAEDRRRTVAWHSGRYVSYREFRAAVSVWRQKLDAEPFTAYALFTGDAYPFAVLLFALLQAGKEVWLPGNNRPGTAELLQQKGCHLIGDWSAYPVCEVSADIVGDDARTPSPLDPEAAKLVIFTSGSTGEAKPVLKHLTQLQAEIDVLERRWGERLADSEALATVSHQHIYGLLFRVLWPLSAGRCFHSAMAISPEAMLQHGRPSYWIASPAHLKRLDQHSPWQGLSGLSAIFSSGGPLSEAAARQVTANGCPSVFEIYGSTETGGIAWRRQPDPAWTLFEGIRLAQEQGDTILHSPYLPGNEGLRLDDCVSIMADGRFLLEGRRDRIVKIEEKRLSLSELEQRLVEHPWIAEATALVIEKGRHLVAACVVLSGEGREQLEHLGRKALIGAFRTALHRWFEAVVLPRKWLFLAQMPLNSQGKTETGLLRQLLAADSDRFPHLQALNLEADCAELQIKVPEDLRYFRGHFQNDPLLPGVVQIAWIEHYGRLLFPMSGAFARLEAVKFLNAIRPGNEAKITLHWKPASGKLCFNITLGGQTHSSGRLVYAGLGAQACRLAVK